MASQLTLIEVAKAWGKALQGQSVFANITRENIIYFNYNSHWFRYWRT